ncbi:olfactory receptor 5AS1-like [Protobothrops mucrosquamatus]|uniref:olfactory receptor 5AS1-like n=1 Tax=Protobothrops mucrosquamatus TaxID=103944 RepID=UPI00077561ED|nr:olfactory receptor 5AS1-like [Protobothrops mucrosquamatus]
MTGGNCTEVEEFILLGFTDHVTLQCVLFVIFLLIYSITIVGNVGLIVTVKNDSHLQIPMYFFLSNLSFLDLCYSSVVTPKMLVNFLVERKVILYTGCILQLFFYAGLATTECYLLAVMAYDRYVAICNPLKYTTIMSKTVCISLVVLCYIAGFLNSSIQVGFRLKLTCCHSNLINHFFCDGPPLTHLYCSDIQLVQILLFAFAGFNEVATTSIVVISYCCILATVLQMRSLESIYKAFSTCSSHLIVVCTFYGTVLFMYLRPSSSYSLEQDKIVSVFYVVIIPMLNPIIYSFRNKEVRNSMKKTFQRIPFPS